MIESAAVAQHTTAVLQPAELFLGHIAGGVASCCRWWILWQPLSLQPAAKT